MQCTRDNVLFLTLIKTYKKIRDQQTHNYTSSTLFITCQVVYTCTLSRRMQGNVMCLDKVLTFKMQWKHGGAHDMDKTCVLWVYSCFLLGFNEDNISLSQDTWAEERVNDSGLLYNTKTVDRNRVILKSSVFG